MLQTASNASVSTLNPDVEHSVLPWFAVRVKPNFERTSTAGLGARGFDSFCPTYTESRRWSDRYKTAEFPLFPGYLFCRMDTTCRTAVLSTPGVVGIVSCGSQLLPVSEEEIESVRRAIAGPFSLTPWPFLKAGHRVRVKDGSLAGVEGIVVEEKGELRLVLQVSLLQRSVSLEIDRHAVEPLTTPSHLRE